MVGSEGNGLNGAFVTENNAITSTDALGKEEIEAKRTNKKLDVSKDIVKNEKPACFDNVLERAKLQDKFGRYGDVELNKRFVSNMFLPGLDTEAISANMEGLDINEFAEGISATALFEKRMAARNIRIERCKQFEAEVLTIDCHGDNKMTSDATRRAKPRIPKLNKDNRNNPTHVFPTPENLPYLAHKVSTSNIIGTLGSNATANADLVVDSYKSNNGNDAFSVGDVSRHIEAEESKTLVSLPSVHSGLSVTVPVANIDKYFGKGARSGFFEHYRSMADSSLVFANVKMGRNEDDQWINMTDKLAIDLIAGNDITGTSSSGRSPSPDSGTTRSGWDSSLNQGGERVGILQSPRHSGRAIYASERLPRHNNQSSPCQSPFMSNEGNLSSPDGNIDRLSKSSVWASDAATFRKCVGDLDSLLLSAPTHQFYDTVEARLESKRSISDCANDNVHSNMSVISEHMSPFTDHVQRMRLPCLSDVKSVSEDGVAAPFVSPRTKFVASCIDRGLSPLPSVVMRKLFNTKINLAHFGIGDERGCAFAECLKTLPSIESINLCDNNLTDAALYPLICACSHISGLQELNLSLNKIDAKASRALADFLSSPKCPLYSLVLVSSDVDDSECANFVECLETNRHLCELDLSNNLLGSDESIPGAKTGGAALASYLVTKECRLRSLKLAWNSIRQNTAIALASSLGKNNTLTYLDLSYNALGSAAGEVIGDSILDNKILKTLILDNNNLGSTACVTICIGVCQNLAIKRLSLDENPIGEAGAKMIMQVPVLIGNRVDLSAANCNTVMRDSSCWYDLANPCRTYSLDLSKPFERAVAFSVLQVVASHSSYIIPKAHFQEDRTNYDARKGATVVKKFGPKEELQFVQGVATDKEDYFDDEQRMIVKGLRTLLEAAGNTEKGKKLFAEADIDRGGDLDREELRLVMEKLGVASDPEKMAQIFAVFDLDGSGRMTLQDFLAVLKSQCREADARLKDLTTYPVLCVKGDVKKNKKYLPPRKGILHLTVVDGFEEKETFSVLTSTDQNNALKMAIKMGDTQLINEAVRASKIRYAEAETLFRRMYKESGMFAASIARLLPQMKTNTEAKQLVDKVTGGDRNKMAQIKQALGIASKTIFGMYNGYYQLDLSYEYHRICLSRLFEQSSRFNTKRAAACWLGYGKLGDTSQHGNWTSFRNELYNKEPIEVTPERFTPMPRSGILEFDFSGAVGPSPEEGALSDEKVCNVMHNLYLLKDGGEKVEAETALGRMKRELLFHKPVTKNASRLQLEKALRPDGKKSVYECPRNVSAEQGASCEAFYDALLERRAETREYAQLEVIGVNFAPGEGSADELALSPSSTANMSPINSPTAGVPSSPLPFSNAVSMTVEACVSLLDEAVVGQANDEAKSANEATALLVAADTGPLLDRDDQSEGSFEMVDLSQDDRKRSITALRGRLEALVDGPMAHKISGQAKAARFCEVVEETFSSVWLNCRQVSLLLQKLPFGDLPQSKNFGSYSVGLAVSLFGRIVDPENIDIVLRVFSAHDAACFWCRIGYLNLFNPVKPEGTLQINLARREEAIVARILIYMSIVEPGNNMPQPMFKWKREMDATPGFEITAPWATNDGLPKKGILGLTFYSGGGGELEGCMVNKDVRRALLQFVLADEVAIDKDPLDSDAVVDLEAIERAPNSAIKVLQSDAAKQMWNEYLWPGCLK